MFTAYLVVTICTIVANASVALADLGGVRFALANAAEVGVPRSWVPVLGALKAAGAAGLVLGVLGVHLIGVAAAIGLVAFFVGAIFTHLRARGFYNLAFPGAFLALASAALLLALMH